MTNIPYARCARPSLRQPPLSRPRHFPARQLVPAGGDECFFHAPPGGGRHPRRGAIDSRTASFTAPCDLLALTPPLPAGVALAILPPARTQPSPALRVSPDSWQMRRQELGEVASR